MKLLSVFSGCGGLDLGFEKAGFKISLACDFDKKIEPTFAKNFPDVKRSWNGIENIKVPLKVDGLIGGPPCQSWSLAGAKRGVEDPRGKLFFEYIKILNKCQPKFFLAENVKGILSPKHQKAKDNIIKLMQDAGYNVDCFLVNAKDYGVAQDRQRVFFIGYRNDLKILPSKPCIIKKRKTLGDILKNLPPAMPSYGKTLNIELQNEYLVAPWSPQFYSRNRVRNYKEQSFTAITFVRALPIHPQAPKMQKITPDQWIFDKNKIDLYRRFTIREYARIQSFPDTFEFEYSKLENAYKMIGNAVPVDLAYQWAKHIKNQLKNG